MSQCLAFGLQSTPKRSLSSFGRSPALSRDTSPLVQHVQLPSAQRSAVVDEVAVAEQPKGRFGGLLSRSRGGANALASVDIPLMAYFFFWYVGNYYYNITNKLALKAAGGSSGYPMTISSLQLGVGCLYAMFLWVAPDSRAKPTITFDDVVKMLPVAFCAMGAHCASVFALSAGAVSFGQIVKVSSGTAFTTVRYICYVVIGQFSDSIFVALLLSLWLFLLLLLRHRS